MRAWICLACLELACAAPALAGPDPDPAAAAEAGERVVFDVFLQDRATGKVDEFRRERGVLYAPRRLLLELGIAPPPGTAEWVALDSVPGLAAQEDGAQQALRLRLDPSLRPLTVREALADDAPPLQPLAYGASLDYSVSALRQPGGGSDLAARINPRGFGPFGVISHDLLYNSADTSRWQRLETWWQRDFPQHAMQLRLGDAITPGPAWSRALRYGGLHWGTDFSLRPDLITYPLPGFQGEAAVPSALDVIVNGLRQPQGEIPDGPFAIPRLPVISGGGEALVVVTDALGREQVSRVPFYVSTALLRPGLQDFSLDAGRLRRGFSDTYTEDFAAAALRRGFSERVTGEAQLQAAEGLNVAGAGAITRIGQLGAVQLAYAHSRGAGCDGGQWFAASEWQRGALSLRTRQQWKKDNYCDLAALQGQAVPRRESQFTLGLTAGGSQFSLSRIARHEDDGSALRLESLFWSRRLGARCHLSLGLQRVRDAGRPRDTAGQFSLLLPLDGAGTALALDVVGGARDRQVISLQRPPPTGPGWGYRLENELQYRDLRAAATLHTDWSALDLEAQWTAAGTALRAGAEGALAWLGGPLFASRRLGDAFALLDVGAPGVSVLRENQWQGRSDAQGLFLTTELRAYEANHLSFDARELPPEVQAAQAQLLLRPYRGGVRADFGVRPAAAQEITVRLADGRPAPTGSAIWLDGQALQQVGHDGRVYLPPPAPGAVLELRGAAACRLRAEDAAQWRCEVQP
jgi:outer membrane usher protein